MHSELKIIENVILKELKTASSKSHLTSEIIEQWCVIVNAQEEIIENLFVENDFRCSKKRFKHYIQCHQKRLILLADALFETFLQQPAHLQLLEEVYHTIENILKFIETQFPDFFNLDSPVPRKTKSESAYFYKKQLPTLKKRLNALNEELSNITLYPLTYLANDNQNSLTYRQLYYLERLYQTIESFKISNRPDATGYQFEKLLIGINYNSWRFFNYLTNNIASEINEEQIITTQIKILSLHLKLVNQANIQINIIYNPFQKGIHKMVRQWLTEELKYYEKQLQLTQANPNPSIQENIKINTDLSVPQLAYILRLFHDIGVLKISNITKTLEKIASNTTTKKTDHISAESLRIQFNAVEDSTRSSVKAILIKMMNQINKYKLILCLFWIGDFDYDLVFQQILDSVTF